jgi:hypothetical protein
MENIELAKLILKQIDAFPESFDMNSWVAVSPCGTVACIAGHAMLLSGYSWGKTLHPGGYYISRFTRPDGTVVDDNQTEGQKLLGLADDEYFTEYAGDPMGLFWLENDEAVARLRSLAGE